MTINETAAALSQAFVEIVRQIIPDAPSVVIRFGAAALLGALALTLLIFALRLLRRNGPSKSPSSHNDIPRTLQQRGMVMDIINSINEDDVCVRCVVTSSKSGKIKCEIIERLDIIKSDEGSETTCVFAPIKTGKGKINSFTAKLLESDRSGRKTDRLVLSSPSSYQMVPRRKHARKRVADQQFIRVKLWIASPYSSDISFEDATPQIGVNSFATDSPEQISNAVVNISNGGLGLSIKNQVIPETCAVGAPVSINLFMFNFKEKAFRPYWYSGQIRSMEEGRPNFTRIGIEFDGSAETSTETGLLRWSKF